MSAPYLGKIPYKWCERCKIPILKGERCPLCGSPLEDLRVTPPGELKIAFSEEIEWLKEELKEEYGEGVSNSIFKPKELVLINKAPGEDRTDEIIVGKRILFVLKYDLLLGKWQISLHPPSFPRIDKKVEKRYVVADKGAIKAVLEGKNLLRPGILEADPSILPGEHVAILDEEGKVWASGISKVNGDELVEGRGVGIKVKQRGREDTSCGSLQDFLRANEGIMREEERRAIQEIKWAYEKVKKPIIVSFSGGKDSMASLLLTMKSGLPFKVCFIDTGLEFPQTIEYVKRVEEKYGIRVEKISSGGLFWKVLDRFGPPARDFRWCCKVLKTGPMMRYLKKNFPEGVLAIIGQRKYESAVRSRSPRIWKNPWIPLQTSFSPIQNWTSLHVWTYLMIEKAPINELYRMGFHRIGCYLCPAGEVGDFDRVKEAYPEGWERWKRYLKDLGGELWIKFGLWRWRELPKSMIRFGKLPERIRRRDWEEVRSKLKKFLRYNLSSSVSTSGRSISTICLEVFGVNFFPSKAVFMTSSFEMLFIFAVGHKVTFILSSCR